MCKIQHFKKIKEYFELTKKVKGYNPYLFFHLDNSIRELITNQNDLVKFFYVQDLDDFTFCLWKKNECLLYSNNENEKISQSIIEELKFEKFKKFTFSGTKNIIDNIFSKFKVSSTEIKYRKYYSCNKIQEKLDLAEGNLAMADENYLLKLTDFTNEFYQEFYDEDNSDIYGLNVVINGIKKNNLLQWEIKGVPVALLQYDYETFEFPIIRFVYVSKELRSKGIGSSIVYETTKGLLQKGHEKCMLYTDGNNPYSNKSFQNSGYELKGEYVSKFKYE